MCHFALGLNELLCGFGICICMNYKLRCPYIITSYTLWNSELVNNKGMKGLPTSPSNIVYFKDSNVSAWCVLRDMAHATFLLHLSQYDGCWWPGVVWRQGICDHHADVGRSAHIRGASVLCLKAVFVWNLIWLIYTTFVYLQSYKIL